MALPFFGMMRLGGEGMGGGLSDVEQFRDTYVANSVAFFGREDLEQSGKGS